MYSKANFHSSKEIVIPENYRGNAFVDPLSKSETVEQSDSVAQNTAPEPQQTESKHPQHTNALLSSIMPPKVSNPSGILSNIGLEEMLIVGILILLSQSDTDDDVLLLLFILLFYK